MIVAVASLLGTTPGVAAATLPGGTAAAASTAGWHIQHTPNPTGAVYTNLYGVACPTPSLCMAVGFYVTHTGTFPLVERWNGTTWAIDRTADPPGAHGELLGISCPTSSFCAAVGDRFPNTSTVLTLVELWNGNGWTFHPTPNRRGATSNIFLSAACPSSTSCTAVGYYHTSTSPNNILVEHWNGTAWAIGSVPKPANVTYNEFVHVACATTSACQAVGWYGKQNGGEYTLAERWNGGTWGIEPTPSPGVNQSDLFGVACASASACTSVGSYLPGPIPLAERWSGSAWVRQIPSSPTNDSELVGVTCPVVTACTAVGGFYTASSAQVVLAEHWNGSSWATQATPTPSGAVDSLFQGVACQPTACVAVGYFLDSAGNAFTLAERDA